MYADIYLKSWGHRNSLNLRLNSLRNTSWKIVTETVRCNPVPKVNSRQ